MNNLAQLLREAKTYMQRSDPEFADRLEQAAASLEELETRLAAAEADAERLDWLEECPYWVTVQTQPHGDFIHSGSGHGIRAAIDAARGGDNGT